MKRAIRTSLTIAMATVMIGFAARQARADRVGYMVDRCFGASCLPGSVRIGELSLAFTESSSGVVDSAASGFSPEMGGVSGLSFAGASVRSENSARDANAAQRSTEYRAKTSSLLLPAAGMSLSFSRLQTPIFASSIDLGRSVSTTSNSSFSVTGVDLKVSKTTRPYGANGAQPGGNEEDPGAPPGGAPVPEPATMLLLGTGLAGAAAIVRKRLKVRNSK